MEIKSGSIIRASLWPEPVEVIDTEDVDDYIRIIGVMLKSRIHIDQIVAKADIAQLAEQEVKPLFGADPRTFFLALEAYRYRFASLYDPLLAMNVSKVDPLPHQVEAVYGYVLRQPRIRFLIADDPGAGKTIMAGLIIKELKLRNLAKRILIVAPGHLKDQWRRELKERFEEHFMVVDRNALNAFYGQNVWQREPQVITSLDFAKQSDILNGLTDSHFDLVIVDEAHKMSATRYSEKVDKTARYRLGERLSEIATHLLFLTATPHRGDPESFRLFLDLLEPGFFATTEMMNASIQQRENPLFIRRLKEDLKDFEGRPLFLPRHVKTKSFNLGIESPAEKELYNALSRYVQDQYNRALRKDKRHNVAFALVILQRRLASSTYALLKSLERRKHKLESLLSDAHKRESATFKAYDLDDEVEDMSEAERWQQEAVWETLSVAESREELRAELRTLAQLLEQASAIANADPPVETKLRHLKLALTELNEQHPGAKMLIFTESRDTLDYLTANLRRWGYAVCTIHGGMPLEERIKAEATFKHEAQIMVATEAAGEGINLQFCHLMINYDIPWNPNRLEQRMGRIHRYGQAREVFIVNLVAEDTREGRVLQTLLNKLAEIQQALGSDKVFDVLGDIIEIGGKNLAQLLLEAAANARSIDEILKEIDITVDAEYLERVRRNLGESLATRYIDYTRIRAMADQAREHRLIPEYTEAFFLRAMEKLGGRWHKREVADYPQATFWQIETVPAELRRIAEEPLFQKQFGSLMKRYSVVTFDKEAAMRVTKAEWVTFGHPLFEAVMQWIERRLATALQEGAVFTDPDGVRDGILLFYQGEIRDGKHEVAGTRLFALFADRRNDTIELVNPAILWDLSEGAAAPLPAAADERQALEQVQKRARSLLIPALQKYRDELLRERQRQADIKQKYGLQSLETLIVKLDGDLIDLQIRKERGEPVDLAIANKQDQKQRYERAMQELQTTLEQECRLSISTPHLLGLARVVPAPTAAVMVSDADIEQIGMAMAMQYERSQGWTPEDVSAQNLGFDVRSTSPDGRRRYIEVKARAGAGPVALTQNEWFKAKRLQDEYYLYVVLHAATQPALHRIQNPAAVLRPDQQVEVRFIVAMDDILAHAQAQ